MIIVEDGSIVANANSYITLKEADDYLLARGMWDMNSDSPEEMLAKKEQSIIRACDYMNTLIWKGCLVDVDQELALPRIYDDKEQETYIIPKAIKKAQIELASIFYNGTDLFTPVDKSILQKTETVDVISESTTYSDNKPDTALYNSVMGLLKPYLMKIEGEQYNTTIGRFVV